MACLIILIEVVAGRALQLGTEVVVSRVDASEKAWLMEVQSVRGACPTLDQYVQPSTTSYGLNNLQDQVCPVLSDPQRTGN
jgi:hypothetical protein